MEEGTLRANVIEAKINDVAVSLMFWGFWGLGWFGVGKSDKKGDAVVCVVVSGWAVASLAPLSDHANRNHQQLIPATLTNTPSSSSHPLPPTPTPTPHIIITPSQVRYERPGAGDNSEGVEIYSQGEVVPAERVIAAAGFKKGEHYHIDDGQDAINNIYACGALVVLLVGGLGLGWVVGVGGWTLGIGCKKQPIPLSLLAWGRG